MILLVIFVILIPILNGVLGLPMWIAVAPLLLLATYGLYDVTRGIYDEITANTTWSKPVAIIASIGACIALFVGTFIVMVILALVASYFFGILKKIFG